MKLEQKQEVKQAVLNYIQSHGGVTYVVIEKIFDRMGYDWQDDYEMRLPGHDNIVLWSGWSPEAFQIVGDLMHEKTIEPNQTSIFVYLADGKALPFPIAKKIFQYKKPRWLPIVFNAWREEEC